jgi:hypothetical protein
MFLEVALPLMRMGTDLERVLLRLALLGHLRLDLLGHPHQNNSARSKVLFLTIKTEMENRTETNRVLKTWRL